MQYEQPDSSEQIKSFTKFLAQEMRDMGILDDLRKAGLTEDSELKTKQQAGAGAVPQQNDNLAVNVKSVPQPDR